MRKIRLLFVIMSVFMLVSCNWPTDDELTEVDASTFAEIESFIHFYKETFIEAVNTRRYSMIAPYLVTRSSFNQSVQQYVENAEKKNMTKELASLEVENVYVDQVDEYYADVYEKVIITEEGTESVIERNVQFHIDRLKDDSLRVVKIRERSDD